VTPIRVAILAILLTALVAGVAMYYLQVYAFYDELVPEEAGPVVLTRPDGTIEPLPVSDLRAIDSDSSPIRFRSCFTAEDPPDMLAGRFEGYEGATPLTAPGWFDCFDAREIGTALEAGEARAFLSVRDVQYGIDRVVAVLPDGRGFAWHQINACGEVVFDGNPPPPGCPPVPERPN
jgi:hypothetical protein